MESTLLETIDETLETIIKQLNDKHDRLYDALLSCGENLMLNLSLNTTILKALKQHISHQKMLVS